MTPDLERRFRLADYGSHNTEVHVEAAESTECEKCKHGSHEPGACGVNVGTGYLGTVLCRCGTQAAENRP